jgi:phosphatidylglycerol---prolipoprotein diacylglyceryl transferase
MWMHTLDPVLIEIFGLQIRYYGLVYVIGFILTILLLQRKKESLNLSKDEVYDFVFYLMVGILIGSRVFHVLFWEPSYYLSDPIKIIYVWQGGMAFHGGLVGAVLSTGWFANKKKIKFYKLADALVVPALIALALGRIANFINGELYGPKTTLPWCVDFGDGTCRHPYQIYAAIKRFALLGIVVWIDRKKNLKDGFLFWITILLLGIGRFALDFYRLDELYIGLSMGQLMAIPMVLIASMVLLTHYKRNLRKVFKAD